MAIDERIIFTVRIAGRPYTLRVAEGNAEGYIRKAAKTIEHKIAQYHDHFSHDAEGHKLEEPDYLGMVAIQAESENVARETEIQIYEDKIKSLIAQLDDYLNN